MSKPLAKPEGNKLTDEELKNISESYGSDHSAIKGATYTEIAMATELLSLRQQVRDKPMIYQCAFCNEYWTFIHHCQKTGQETKAHDYDEIKKQIKKYWCVE